MMEVKCKKAKISFRFTIRASRLYTSVQNESSRLHQERNIFIELHFNTHWTNNCFTASTGCARVQLLTKYWQSPCFPSSLQSVLQSLLATSAYPGTEITHNSSAYANPQNDNETWYTGNGTGDVCSIHNHHPKELCYSNASPYNNIVKSMYMIKRWFSIAVTTAKTKNKAKQTLQVVRHITVHYQLGQSPFMSSAVRHSLMNDWWIVFQSIHWLVQGCSLRTCAWMSALVPCFTRTSTTRTRPLYAAWWRTV